MRLTAPTHQKPRILIVDDEADNIELLTTLFEADCRIDSSTSGELALKYTQQHDYDAVLLDIMMHPINGFEVLKSIRQEKTILDLPVIVLSAMQSSDDIVKGMRLGANDYITKPFNIDVVSARVHTQIALKRLMNERRQMIENLRSANALNARMMQIASHDLKNPLNNLRLMIAIMRRQLDDQNQFTTMLNMTDESLRNMLGVVEDFLDQPQQVGQHYAEQPRLQTIDTQTVVHHLIQEYQATAVQKGLHMSVDVQGNVQGDTTRIAQVISNLLSNAIKYSPTDGDIIITSERRAGMWRLSIRDYGPGIPEAERESLFQPFSQISTQPTGGETSTGLGLWIVAEMMRMQGGRVGVTHLRDGTCFWIELPLAETDLSSRHSSSGPASAGAAFS